LNDGQYESASQRITSVDVDNLQPYYKFIRIALEAALKVRLAAPEQRTAVFNQSRKELGAAVKVQPEFWKEPLLQRVYAACVAQMSREQSWIWSVGWKTLQTQKAPLGVATGIAIVILLKYFGFFS
jgi:hypothetical protein